MSLIASRKSLLLSLASLFSLFNVLWLGYLGWQKAQPGGCPSCHLVPFLPITDVAVAIIGMIASAVLAVLCYFTVSRQGLRYVTLLCAGLCAAFASFLQITNLLLTGSFCPQCLVASIGFYLIFGLMLYEVVISSLWRWSHAIKTAA